MKSKTRLENPMAIPAAYALKNRLDKMSLDPREIGTDKVSKIYEGMKNEIWEKFKKIPPFDDVYSELSKIIQEKNPTKDLKRFMCESMHESSKRYNQKISDVGEFIKGEPSLLVRIDKILCITEESFSIPQGSVIAFGYEDLVKFARPIMGENNVEVLYFDYDDKGLWITGKKRIVLNLAGLGPSRLKSRKIVDSMFSELEEGTEILLFVDIRDLKRSRSGIIDILEKYNVKRIKSFGKNLFAPESWIDIYSIEVTVEEPSDRVEILNGDRKYLIKMEEMLKMDSWAPENIELSRELSRIHMAHPTPLKKVIDIIPSGEFKTEKYNKDIGEETTEYYILRAKHIKDGTVDIKDLVSEKNLFKSPELPHKYLVRPKDLLIVVKGDIGRNAMAPENLPENTILSNTLLGLRCKEDVLNPEYLKIFFASNTAKKLFQTKKSGNFIPLIRRKDLINIEIPLLEIETQNEIVQKYRQIMEEYEMTIKRAEKRKDMEISEIYRKMGLMSLDEGAIE